MSGTGNLASAALAGHRREVHVLTRWYRTGVIYSVDVGLFQDSNDDGVGDFRGMMSRLDYLARLGIVHDLAAPDPPVAAPGRRLRHHRLFRRAPAVRRDGRLRDADARGR